MPERVCPMSRSRAASPSLRLSSEGVRVGAPLPNELRPVAGASLAFLSPIDQLLSVLFATPLRAERAPGVAGAMVGRAAGARPVVAIAQQAAPTAALLGCRIEMLD